MLGEEIDFKFCKNFVRVVTVIEAQMQLRKRCHLIVSRLETLSPNHCDTLHLATTRNVIVYILPEHIYQRNDNNLTLLFWELLQGKSEEHHFEVTINLRGDSKSASLDVLCRRALLHCAIGGIQVGGGCHAQALSS